MIALFRHSGLKFRVAAFGLAKVAVPRSPLGFGRKSAHHLGSVTHRQYGKVISLRMRHTIVDFAQADDAFAARRGVMPLDI
jgi:hypothetical protein